jgi:tyrosine-protein kinase Etk/Wzc
VSSTQTEEPVTAFELGQRQPERFDLLDTLILFARHKWLIMKITAVFAAAAIGVSLLLPSHYTASATILPPQQTPSAASFLMSQFAGAGTDALTAIGKDIGLKNPTDLYVGILKSRTIEDAVVQKFELMKVYSDKEASEARSDLEDATRISGGKEGLITISVEDKDPKRAAGIANSYVGELNNVMRYMALSEASQRRLFYERELQFSKDELSNAEVSLKETQQKTGMIQLDTQAKAAIEVVGKLRAQISAREVQVQAMSSFATDRNPDVVLVQQELAALRGQLSNLDKEQSTSADPLIATGKLPAVGLEYVRKLRELKYRESIFELLSKQYEIARLDEGKQAAVIQVVDVAVAPDKKSSPHRLLISLLGVLIGFLAAIMSVFCREIVTQLSFNPENRVRFSKLTSLLFTKK